MKTIYFCAICAAPVRSGRALLCSHCREAFPGNEPWLEMLKQDEHAARELDRYWREEGLEIVPLSTVSEKKLARQVSS